MTNTAPRSPRAMLIYAGFLFLCGVIAFGFSGFSWEHGKTGIIIPTVCALAMVGCAALAAKLSTNRAMGMIGIHVGLLLPLVFAGAIGWRAYAGWQKLGTPDGKTYLVVILAILAVGSLVGFVAILRTRPAKVARS